MATCQMMPNKPTTKVLPAFGETELACTMQQSTTFVKKLVTVAMSTIMYMRGIFPEHCFGDRMVGDLLVKLIRPVQDDEAIGQLIQLMGGCYDAIEKRYLKRMTVLLCTNDEDTESVVESYACEMSYMGGKLSISRNGEELFDSSNGREIKESTVRLMRSLLLSMQTFDSLPGELFIHLKLAYYPDVTPDDYHPHGFVQAQPNTFKFARENTLKFIVGQVHTPFHSVGMHVKSLFCQEWKPDGEDKEIDVSQTEVMNIKQTQNGVTNRPATQKATGKALPPTETQTIGNAKKLQKASTLKKRVPTPHSRVNSIDEVAIRQPNRQGMVPIDASLSPDIPNQEAAQPEPATSQTSYTVRCPCRFDMDDGLMVQCDKCSTWQHCVCFGLVKETDVPSIHYCVICSRECQLDCTDPDLAALHGVALRAMCLWRKAVFVVLTEHKSDPFTDSHLTARLDVESGVAQGILKRLEKEGVVKPKRTIGRGSKSFIAAKSLSVEELKVYFKDSVRMFRGKDKPADSSKEENHVENLTQRTAGLQLGNRKRPITDKQENGISSKDSHISPDKRQYSKRLAKRALERMGAPPPAECSRDSDMIDSQPKRRKQSISKKAIRV